MWFRSIVHCAHPKLTSDFHCFFTVCVVNWIFQADKKRIRSCNITHLSLMNHSLNILVYVHPLHSAFWRWDVTAALSVLSRRASIIQSTTQHTLHSLVIGCIWLTICGVYRSLLSPTCFCFLVFGLFPLCWLFHVRIGLQLQWLLGSRSLREKLDKWK